MARRSFPLIPVLALLLGACGVGPAPIDIEGLAIPLIDAGSPEEIGVLALLNDASTTFEVLDVQVALDRRAAHNLIARRNGPDGVLGTADDRPFASIAEVDAVSYVGRVALQKLLDWARDGGWIAPAGDARERAILALANDSSVTFETLDVDVALDRRAAQGIVDRRPFADLAALDAVPYVGASALDKLAAYALANGYGEGPSDPPPSSDAPSCVIISEYVEGAGANNKAVEIYNCGSEPIALEQVGICLVRNDATSCTSHSSVGAGTLQPGAVHTLCRTRGGTFNDPYPALAAACDHEIGGAAIFSGDDRLMLFHDADTDGRFDAGETVLDTFGDPSQRPSEAIWSETTLRRCDLSPNATDTDAFFTRHPRTDMTHLGVPPSRSCTISHLGGEGDDCLSHDYCEAGLRCVGRPSDGSTANGRCVRAVSGSGADCDRHSPCPSGEICAGWTLWGEGTCVPQWMAGRYQATGERAIADAPAQGVDSSVVVYGLASVPVDIEVMVHIRHPRLTDLRVTLYDPNGDSAVLWDRTTELSEWSRSFVTTGISRDDQVNGRWTLRVEDLVSGQTGTLESFRLFIVSRYD